MYMFDRRNPLYLDPSGTDLTGLYIIAALLVIGVFLWLGAIEPKAKQREAQQRKEDAERAACLENTRRHVEAARAKQELEREKERRKAAEKAAKIEANKSHAEDLQQLLEAKLELARATQAKADREKDEYKRIQLTERAVRLYVQANEVEAKIKKLSE